MAIGGLLDGAGHPEVNTPGSQMPPGGSVGACAPVACPSCVGVTTDCSSGCCRCVGSCQGQSIAAPVGSGPGAGPQAPQDLFTRLADVLAGFGSDGGGGISMPSITPESVTSVPGTASKMNPLAIILILAALAVGGYLLYQRSQKGKHRPAEAAA